LPRGEINRTSYNFVTRQRAVGELLRPYAHGNVLDIGCGSGDLVGFFSEQGVKYMGIDLSAQMIERARANHSSLVENGTAAFKVADCEHLPFDDRSFDVISAVALIEYLPNPAAALDEIQRVVTPGGYALLTVPHKSCINYRIRDLIEPVTKAFFPLYWRIKRPQLAIMQSVTHYRYDPRELDSLLGQRGFRKRGHRFTNFHVIPHPLDHLVPKLYMRLSEWMDRRQIGDSRSYWASNYIALYEKMGGRLGAAG
jgi:ubiquinone/menaquinone biosynthesis C-methylase UbiE